MHKDLEQADNCGGVYHKSLLYLIHYALEPERKEPILGLESSLRADPALRKLFGLEGPPGAAGEINGEIKVFLQAHGAVKGTVTALERKGAYSRSPSNDGRGGR
jgi:hypothetical protein